MKIKRFVAQDMRQALRMVRETLGEDAVILSNRTVDGGIELTAAIDLVDYDAVEGDHDQAANPLTGAASAPAQQGSIATPSRDEALEAMRNEMQQLRRWMQAELAGMSWHDLGQRAPLSQALLGRLMGFGLDADLARDIAARVGDVDDLERAWRKALHLIAGELRIGETNLLDSGGVVALVGPTGVGKTTTIAKIAARFALRNGQRSVALITTDSFRIGARDQLQTYARILNVPVRMATTPDEMDAALNQLGDRRLILIDTAGMAAAHERVRDQYEILQAAGPGLQTLLALSATTESAALQRAFRLFADFGAEGCVLTKLDEAASLGGLLAALMRSALPVAVYTDGQRVPEDLHIARAHPIVTQAATLYAEDPVEPDAGYLAMAYGGAHAHADV